MPLDFGGNQVGYRGDLWLTLPAAGRIRDFYPIERALTGRTYTNHAGDLLSPAFFMRVILPCFMLLLPV